MNNSDNKKIETSICTWGIHVSNKSFLDIYDDLIKLTNGAGHDKKIKFNSVDIIKRYDEERHAIEISESSIFSVKNTYVKFENERELKYNVSIINELAYEKSEIEISSGNIKSPLEAEYSFKVGLPEGPFEMGKKTIKHKMYIFEDLIKIRNYRKDKNEVINKKDIRKSAYEGERSKGHELIIKKEGRKGKLDRKVYLKSELQARQAEKAIVGKFEENDEITKANKIEKYYDLMKKGAISKEEFENKKRDILK